MILAQTKRCSRGLHKHNPGYVCWVQDKPHDHAVREKTKGIEIEVGLHQSSALSPLLFVIIIDVITEEIEEGTPWAMLFADDLVLCDPDREMMELRLERWRECMEKNGLKVRRAKTEHLQTTG